MRWTLVFIHKPLWTYAGSDGPEGQAAYAFWSQVETMLQGRKHTAYAGHFHTYNKHRRGQANYFVLATTGGGSQLRGSAFGEFDHVVWITMTDHGPRMANLLLDGIADENIRVAENAEH